MKKSKTILAIGGETFANKIRDVLSPLGVNVINEIAEQKIKVKCKRGDISVVISDDDNGKNQKERLRIIKVLQKSKKDFILVSFRKSPSRVCEAKDFGAVDFITRPYSHREFISRFNAVINEKVRIVCIGGGTGLFHVLVGLKKLPGILLTSIVSMSDDGGSSGRLKASFGMLPPGDVRRSLVALSNAPEIMNQLMTYRFQKGDGITGHNVGNLFLAALTGIKGSLPEAIRTISDVLNIRGIVLPVTNTETTLCARFEDGAIVKGESKIDLSKERDIDLHIQETWHEPETECNIEAFSSIINADIIIIGPGDLFTSVVTNLLVKNLCKALSKTNAKKIYICNLMTKPGETAKYDAFDHVKEIIKYMGGDYLDYIVISNTKLSNKSIREYNNKDQSPVAAGDIKNIHRITKAEIILADVGHETELVRHDSVKTRKEINKILKREISRK